MATDNRKIKDAKAQTQAHLPAHISDLHCFTETNGVITTTMFDVPGYRVVKVLGAVYGITVRSRNWAAGLTMVIKSVAGGELKWFTSMVSYLFTCSIYRLSLSLPIEAKENCTDMWSMIVVRSPKRRYFSRGGRGPVPWGQRHHRLAFRRGRHGRVCPSLCLWHRGNYRES